MERSHIEELKDYGDRIPDEQVVLTSVQGMAKRIKNLRGSGKGSDVRVEHPDGTSSVVTISNRRAGWCDQEEPPDLVV